MYPLIYITVFVLGIASHGNAILNGSQYAAAYQENQEKELERQIEDTLRTLAFYERTHQLCEVGTTLISFIDSSLERMKKMAYYKRMEGWDIAVIHVNVTGRCILGRYDRWEGECEATHVEYSGKPCLIGSGYWLERHSLTYKCDKVPRWPWQETACQPNYTIPVIRITIPENVTSGPMAAYQVALREARTKKEEESRAKSDRHMASYFDAMQVSPSGTTYISLHRWPSEMRHINASVEAWRAHGVWNVSLRRISVRGAERRDDVDACVLLHSESESAIRFLSYMRRSSYMCFGEPCPYARPEDFSRDLWYQCGAENTPDREIDVIEASLMQ